MSDTRRNISLLPEVHQTPTLRRFFGSTVDVVFNPGRSSPFSGFVGQKPGYYDPEKDFYIPEPTESRASYQLEAAMVQTNDLGTVVRALSYDDLIGYLSAQNADITNQERLFESDAYAWAPPIDIDKLSNFRFYNWFGLDQDELPALPLMSPLRVTIANGTARSFLLPDVLPDARRGDEELAIFVRQPGDTGFRRREFNRIDEDEIELLADSVQATIPPVNSMVLTIRYGDLAKFLNGRVGYDLSLLTNDALYTRAIADGIRTSFLIPDVPGLLAPAVLQRMARAGGVTLATDRGAFLSNWTRVGDRVVFETPPEEGSEIVVFRDGRLGNLLRGRLGPSAMPKITSGLRVRLHDANTLAEAPAWVADRVYAEGERINRGGLREAVRNNSRLVFDPEDWREVPERAYVEGVGREIRLVFDSGLIWGFPAQHATIERSSRDRNPWSARNHWVHRDSFAWSGIGIRRDLRASRPIIEFERDNQLSGYGENNIRQRDVDGIVTHGLLYGYDWDFGVKTLWRANAAYAIEDRVVGPDGLPYEAIRASNRPNFDPDDWRPIKDRFPFDLLDVGNETDGLPGSFDKNGAFPFSAANLWPIGTVFADNGYPQPKSEDDEIVRNYYRIKLGDRILVTDNPLTPAPLRNRVFTVGVRTVTNEFGVDTDYMVLTPDALPLPEGSVVRVKKDPEHPNNDPTASVVLVSETLPVEECFIQPCPAGATGPCCQWMQRTTELQVDPVFPHGRDFWFDGATWQRAPLWRPYSEPVFTLYDSDAVALTDPGRYPNSKFMDSGAGKIFCFARSENTVEDTLLGFPVKRDSRGEVMFESAITRRVTFGNDDTVISGLYYWKRDGVLRTVWHKQAVPLRQPTIQRGSANPVALQRGDAFRLGVTPVLSVVVSFNDPNINTRTLEAVVRASNAALRAAGLDDRIIVTREENAFVIRNLDNTSIYTTNVSGRPLTTLGIAQGTVGVPSLPLNLQANPTNNEPVQVTRGDIYDHCASLILANIGEDGGVPYAGNLYRDSARDLSLGTRILQQRSPLLRLMLTASDMIFDIPEAVRFVEREYTRFRAKFLTRADDLRKRGTIRDGDPVDGQVRTVLDAIRVEKGAGFPFFFSPMGGGRLFIPPTPAAMGLLPVHTPRIVADTTYPGSPLVIVGHDGSRTPAFGDWRDNLLLSFERLVHDNLPEVIRSRIRPNFDLDNWLDNAWQQRPDGYSYAEYVRGYAVVFERWAQINGLDYKANTTYAGDDPFSWNYRGARDDNGNRLPGGWRGIYRWYFGTDRPHEAPWEMLGFVEEPAWWETEYGPAPYTSGNISLWRDLRDGVIRAGERAGTHAAYARPGLFTMLPVNAAGDLLDPVACRIITQPPSFQQASAPWEIGDMGPVETLWAATPSFGFARLMAGLVLKPARQVEFGWDTLDTGIVAGDQWVQLSTGNRPRPNEGYVNGETVNGEVKTVYGIQQFLVDRLISMGQAPVVLGEAVRGLTVRLAYKVAGFTSSDDLRVVADDFGLVPSEDVSIFFYNSPITRSEVYSGVIIEWTGRGWAVIGYNARDPFFTIMPSDENGPREVVGLNDVPDPVVLPWRPNTFYAPNVLVSYEDSTYRALRSHTSGPTFEMSFWVAAPGADRQSPRVNRYLRALGTIERVAYGTEFVSRQEVADFLFAYGRWLESRGWRFEVADPQGIRLRDWRLMVREFLNWSMMDWAPGGFVALSPGAEELHFTTESGLVIDVEQSMGGFYGLLDRYGQPIPKRSSRISRLDGDVTLKAQQADIFCARLGVIETEHMLIFSNTTIFGDTIYSPMFNIRQPRLRLIGRRTSDWAGRPQAAGYVLSEDRLLPSFEKATDDLRLAFGIEEPDQATMRSYARHLTGFETRPYLDNLLLSDTQQFEFHQGLIQAKGSPGSLDRLLRSQRITGNRDIAFLEEWAIRAANFGLPPGPVIEVALRDTDVRQDPQFIRLTPTPGAPLGWISLNADDARWINPVAGNESVKTFFPLAPDDSEAFPEALPTAGWVRLDEVDHTVLNDAALPTFYTTLADGETFLTPGDRIWSYGAVGRWKVWRVTNLGTGINRVADVITNGEDLSVESASRLMLRNPHGLSSADVGSLLVINEPDVGDSQIAGIWIIRAVNVADNWIEIDAPLDGGLTYEADDEAAPSIFILRDVRFRTAAARDASTIVFEQGELVYIDAPVANGAWEVQRRSGTGWVTHRVRPKRVDPARIARVSVHDLRTRLEGLRAISEPSLIPRVSVIDPVAGIIAGVADRELSYKTDFDPARYVNDADNDAWAENEVGMLWWDTSTVRFLEPFTDEITEDGARNITELTHRMMSWNRIAPGTVIEVYEWTESPVGPERYVIEGLDGIPAAGDETPFVVRSVFDPRRDRQVTLYYFWVRNKRTVPAREGRKLSAVAVTEIIESPSLLDVAWFAPISQDGLLIGGLGGGLNDETTMLRIALMPEGERVDGEWRPNGERHDEWVLIRPGDERSQPSNDLWDKMRDSLVGFTDVWDPDEQRFRRLPKVPAGTPPEVVSARHVGILSGQTMFDPDIEMAGRRAARRSFVDNINAIFARTPIAVERPMAVEALEQADALEQFLTWTQPDDTRRVELPPKEWTYQVYTPEQMQSLMAGISSADRILLNRIASDRPQWSIWTRTIDGDGEFDVALASNFDVKVPDLSSRDLLLLDESDAGLRVAVESDETANGFWTIWRWTGTAFVLHRVQRYRTSDFVNFVDWYADGYSAADPPVLSYANVAERNRIEGNSPSTTLVRLDDDGMGRWVWTVWDGTTWLVVARQNGTIALSANLYASGRSEHDGSLISTVSRRDGSWELRSLFDVLRFEVLSDAEANELFFAMLHFVHSQQDAVDWAFKTSFLSVAGYGETLERTPVRAVDPTGDLLDYINEVKPYRVKVREILRRYTTESIEVPARITDFDKPPYNDPVVNRVRILDEAFSSDQNRLGDRTGRYRAHSEAMRALGWQSANWANVVSGDERDWFATPMPFLSPTQSPIRRVKVNLRFDRTMPYAGMEPGRLGDGTLDRYPYETAVNRIRDFYTPLPGMKPNDPALLLGLDYAGASYSGSADPEMVLDAAEGEPQAVLNPDVDGRPGLQGRDIIMDKDRLPERLTIFPDDAALVRVLSKATAGEPAMTQTGITVASPEMMRIDHKFIAESNDAVLLYENGGRVPHADYAPGIDPFGMSVNYSTQSFGRTDLLLHVVHLGGPGAVHERYLRRWYAGRGRSYTVPITPIESIPDVLLPEVTVNGQRLADGDFSVSYVVETFISDDARGVIRADGSRSAAQVNAIVRATITLPDDNPDSTEDADIVFVFRRSEGATRLRVMSNAVVAPDPGGGPE